jgi:hypothetical protein
MCLLRGTDWVFKSDRYGLVPKGLNNNVVYTVLQLFCIYNS